MNYFNNVFAMPIRIIETPLLTQTVLARMCRSKKKRIIKKWTKNIGNYKTVANYTIYQTPYGDVCHPIVARALREQLLAGSTLPLYPVNNLLP
jgi:hypothetical protein